MNCNNCGNPVTPELEFCPVCGAYLKDSITENNADNSTEDVFVEETPTENMEYQNQDAVSKNEFTPNVQGLDDSAFVPEYVKPEKPKNKKLRIALIVAAIILVLTAGVFAAEYFGNFFGWFASDEESPSGNRIEVFADDVAKTLTDVKNSPNLLDTTTSMNLKVTLGDEGKKVLLDMLKANANEAALEVLESINNAFLDMEITITDDKYAINMALDANDSDIVEANLIVDINSGYGYLTLPGLQDTPLCIDISQGIPALRSSIETLSKNQQIYNIIPEEEKIKDFVVKFVSLVGDVLGESADQKETVEINGIKNEYGVYSVEITNEKAYAAIEKVLTELKTDETAKEVVNSLGDYTMQPDLYSKFTEGIEDALTDLAKSKDKASSNETISLKLRFDDKNNLIGTTLADNKGKFEFDWRSVAANNKQASIISLKENGKEVFAMNTTGTVSNGLYNGNSILTVQGMDIAEIGAKDIDLAKLQNNILIGELAVKPSHFITRNIPMDEFKNVNFVLSCPDSGDMESFGISIYNGDDFYASAELGYKIHDSAKEISVPQDYTEPQKAEEWTQGINIFEVIGRLSKAGISIPLNF